MKHAFYDNKVLHVPFHEEDYFPAASFSGIGEFIYEAYKFHPSCPAIGTGLILFAGRGDDISVIGVNQIRSPFVNSYTHGTPSVFVDLQRWKRRSSCHHAWSRDVLRFYSVLPTTAHDCEARRCPLFRIPWIVFINTKEGCNMSSLAVCMWPRHR